MNQSAYRLFKLGLGMSIALMTYFFTYGCETSKFDSCPDLGWVGIVSYLMLAISGAGIIASSLKWPEMFTSMLWMVCCMLWYSAETYYPANLGDDVDGGDAMVRTALSIRMTVIVIKLFRIFVNLYFVMCVWECLLVKEREETQHTNTEQSIKV